MSSTCAAPGPPRLGTSDALVFRLISISRLKSGDGVKGHEGKGSSTKSRRGGLGRSGAAPSCSLKDLLERLALDAAAGHRQPDILRKQLAIRPELLGGV